MRFALGSSTAANRLLNDARVAFAHIEHHGEEADVVFESGPDPVVLERWVTNWEQRTGYLGCFT